MFLGYPEGPAHMSWGPPWGPSRECCCRLQWVLYLTCLDPQSSALHSRHRSLWENICDPPPAQVISPHRENTALSPKKRQA